MPRQSWVKVIERILEQAQRPLDSREIAEIAIAEGVKTTRSASPQYSIQAAISRDLKAKGESSRFVVYGEHQDRRKYGLKPKN